MSLFLLAAGGKNFASSFAAAASFETKVTGGGLQTILPLKYLLTAVVSGLCLPIGGGLKNILSLKKILVGAVNLEAEANGGGNQNILRGKKSLEGGRQWLPPAKKVGLPAEYYLAAGKHYQLVKVLKSNVQGGLLHILFIRKNIV